MRKSDSHTTEQPKVYLLRKRGMFYRANAAGYTNSLWEAGRYTKAEATERAYTRARGKRAYDENVYAVHLKKVRAGIERDLRCALQEAQSLADMLETINE